MKKYKRRNFGERKLPTRVVDDNNIEELVFKTFIKHVKDNNLYLAFRWAVNRDNRNKDIVHVLSASFCPNAYNHSSDRMARIGCAFCSCSSIMDILNMLRMETRRHKVENSKEFQMSLMNMVNMLIHNCIEHAVRKDINILEKIGSSVFEEVGKKLFGDDFKDITEEAIDPRQREFIQHMQEIGGDRGMPSREEMHRFIRMMHERMKQQEEEKEVRRVDREWRTLMYDDWDDYSDRDWF